MIFLSLPHKLRLQRHRTESLELAVDIVVTFDQTDVFAFSSGFCCLCNTFDGKVFDHLYRISISQNIAVCILYYRPFRFLGIFCLPFEPTCRTQLSDAQSISLN